MLSNPPTDRHAITNAAPSNERLRSAAAVTVIGMPRRCASDVPSSTIRGSFDGSMSWSTTSEPCNAGVLAKSESRRGAQW